MYKYKLSLTLVRREFNERWDDSMKDKDPMDDFVGYEDFKIPTYDDIAKVLLDLKKAKLAKTYNL